MPEFVHRIMPEAYDSHQRHAFSWIQDHEEHEKATKDAIRQRQAKYKALAFSVSNEEVPEWHRSGKAAKQLKDFIEMLQQKIKLKI